LSFLLDTNHACRLLDPDAFPNASTADPVLRLCAPVVGELWFMVHNSKRVIENEARLRAVLARIPTMPFDSRFVQMFGIIRAELKRAGRPIPTIDVQIAAIARVNGLIVLTADKHFALVDQLRTENWLN
jgi:predicted nucleic acid-binding protein